jgi:hypothetical protein
VSARAEKPMTARERDLLSAVLALVDLPHPASHEERQGYYDDLAGRTARLCGALEHAVSDPDHFLSSVTETCRHFAAQPLGYEAKPASEPATARLADSPGLRQLLEAQGIIDAEIEAGS